MTTLLGILLLTIVYLLALASADPVDALIGAALSAAIVFGLRGFLTTQPAPDEPPPLHLRILRFPRFALAVCGEIVRGTWRVALVVVGIRPLHAPGIVLIPIGERTETGLAVSALTISLSPGELMVDVDHERGVILVHVLDASDPQGVREHFQRFFDRYQRGVFP